MQALCRFLTAVIDEQLPLCAVIGFALMLGDPIAYMEEVNATMPYKLSVSNKSDVVTA